MTLRTMGSNLSSYLCASITTAFQEAPVGRVLQVRLNVIVFPSMCMTDDPYLAGGQHFRAWKQNGTLANSGAWFIGYARLTDLTDEKI